MDCNLPGPSVFQQFNFSQSEIAEQLRLLISYLRSFLQSGEQDVEMLGRGEVYCALLASLHGELQITDQNCEAGLQQLLEEALNLHRGESQHRTVQQALAVRVLR